MFVVLSVQREVRMHRIVICGLSASYHIFPQHLFKGTIFGNKLLKKRYLFRFSLQILSETFLILRKIKRDSITNMLGIHVHYPLFC